MPDNNLVGTKMLEEIIETVIFSGQLSGAIPLSLMLIGPSGGGKSKLLLRYEKTASLHRSDDLTTSGLFDILKLDERDQRKTHIIIPDFNAPLSHKPATSTLLVSNLLTVMSDGSARIDDGRETKEITHAPIGILTAVTPEMYAKNEYKWKMLGFRRRFLPIFYDYSPASVMKVQSKITRGQVSLLSLTPKTFVFKGPKKSIYLNSKEAKDIQNLSMMLAELLALHTQSKKIEENKIKYQIVPGKALLPYAPHLMLQVYAKANALRLNRARVSSTDVMACAELLEFCRYGEPKRL